MIWYVYTDSATQKTVKTKKILGSFSSMKSARAFAYSFINEGSLDKGLELLIGPNPGYVKYENITREMCFYRIDSIILYETTDWTKRPVSTYAYECYPDGSLGRLVKVW